MGMYDNDNDNDTVNSKILYNIMSNKCSNNGTSITSSSPPFRSHQTVGWMSKYEELLNYRLQFGHCLVPNQYPDNPSLAEWVKRQRYQYKLKGMGKYTHMSNDRMIALEKSGFVWNSHDAVWEERLKELKEYKHVNHGNTNVPSFYPPNPPLAVWVKRQRRQYKRLCEGKSTTITKIRVNMLREIDFSWSVFPNNYNNNNNNNTNNSNNENNNNNNGNISSNDDNNGEGNNIIMTTSNEEEEEAEADEHPYLSLYDSLLLKGYKTSSDNDNDDDNEENENINYNDDDTAIKIIGDGGDDGDDDDNHRNNENTNEDENENDDDDDDSGAIIGKENIDEMRIKIKAKDDKEWKLIHSGIMASIGTRITKKSKNKSKRNIGSNNDDSKGDYDDDDDDDDDDNVQRRKTQPKGYYKRKSGNYLAQINSKGRSRYIGTFKNERDAALAVKIAWRKIDDIKSQQLVDDDERTLQASDYKEWKLIRSKVLASIGTRNANKNKDKRNSGSNNDNDNDSYDNDDDDDDNADNVLSQKPKPKGYTKTRAGTFKVQIAFKGKLRYIGTFKYERDAALACKMLWPLVN